MRLSFSVLLAPKSNRANVQSGGGVSFKNWNWQRCSFKTKEPRKYDAQRGSLKHISTFNERKPQSMHDREIRQPWEQDWTDNTINESDQQKRQSQALKKLINKTLNILKTYMSNPSLYVDTTYFKVFHLESGNLRTAKIEPGTLLRRALYCRGYRSLRTPLLRDSFLPFCSVLSSCSVRCLFCVRYFSAFFPLFSAVLDMNVGGRWFFPNIRLHKSRDEFRWATRFSWRRTGRTWRERGSRASARRVWRNMADSHIDWECSIASAYFILLCTVAFLLLSFRFVFLVASLFFSPRFCACLC